MDATVVVAAMGFVATLSAAGLTARSQRRGDREGRLVDARVRIYGECAVSLNEYARATYNRAKARLESGPDNNREGLRQEAYRCNSRVRAAIGQASILTGSRSLEEYLTTARRAIGDLNKASSYAELKSRQEVAYKSVNDALEVARSDLTT